MAETKSTSAVLTYFHGRGRAEQARWMLAATGVPFKNISLDTPEQFAKMKADGLLLFGQLPLLEIDGYKLVQSQAINRYLARRGGIEGKTDHERVVCDMIAETVNDSIGGVIGYPFRVLFLLKQGKDKEAEEQGARNVQAAIDRAFPKFEKVIEANKNSKFIVGSSLTYADVLVAALAHAYEEALLKCLDKYPGMKKIRDNVISIPSVAAYLKSDLCFQFPRGKVAIEYCDNVNKVLSR